MASTAARLLPSTPRAFDRADDADLRFFFEESDGALGQASNYWPLIELAMRGLSDGGTVAQPTAADMRKGSAVEKEARLRAILAQVDERYRRVLSKHYSGTRIDDLTRLHAILPLTARALREAEASGLTPQAWVEGQLAALVALDEAARLASAQADLAHALAQATYDQALALHAEGKGPKPKKPKARASTPEETAATQARRDFYGWTRGDVAAVVAEAQAAYVEAKRSAHALGGLPFDRPRGKDFLAYVRGEV